MGSYVSQVTGSVNNVGTYLDKGWGSLWGKADEAFSTAMSIASTAYTPSPIDVDKPGAADANTNIEISTAGAPNAPELSELDLTYPSIQALTGTTYSPGPAPEFGAEPLALQIPAKPVVVQPADPGDAPAVQDHALPNEPYVDLPEVPTLLQLNLPNAPTLMMPVFTGVSPSANVPELVAPNFIWAEAPYTERLPQLSTKIAQYLAVDHDAAEMAIWGRGQERLERSIDQSVLDLTNDVASRGFALPNGVLMAALTELRAKGVEHKADNAREAMIKAAELNIQKLTVVIQSGVQYEGMWMNYMTQYAQRAFEAAKVMVDVTIKVFESKVAIFNARLQAYQTEAQVHRDLIQAELSKLEMFKIQLEGQKLIGEMNMQDVELYKARLQGALASIEVYKAQISAVLAVIETDKAKLQAYATTVQAYKAKVEANMAEYQAWGEEMRGESVKSQLYETEVKAFAARVDAYKSQEMVGVESEKLKLQRDQVKVELFKSQLGEVDTRVKAYAAEVDALTKFFASESEVYKAVMSGRESEAKVKASIEGLKIDQYKAEALINIEEAKVRVAQLDADIRAFVGRMQAAGAIVSQLAASAMSAFNLSASTGESFSLGVSNSLSESHAFTN